MMSGGTVADLTMTMSLSLPNSLLLLTIFLHAKIFFNLSSLNYVNTLSSSLSSLSKNTKVHKQPVNLVHVENNNNNNNNKSACCLFHRPSRSHSYIIVFRKMSVTN